MVIKKRRTKFEDKETKKILLSLAIGLLVLSALFLLYFHFVILKPGKLNSYVIENKYYGFKLQTPKDWVAEERVWYPEDNIATILEECKNDKTKSVYAYEIGAFRFKSQRYPADLDVEKFSENNLPSGAILEITTNCVPEAMRGEIENYALGNLQIAGEKAIEKFLNLMGFGSTKQISIWHGDVQYIFSEYIYLGSGENSREKENYQQILDKAVLSFEFLK